MTKKEISESLSFYGIKKSKVEADLGMPLNSLSGILKNDKELPKKWVEALRKYVDDLNKPMDDLVIASEKQNVGKDESKIEKVVESTQNQIEGLELDKIAETNTMVEFTYGSGFVSVKGISEELKNDIIKAKTEERNFDQLLKQFNNLVELSEKPKDIKLKLEQIKESAKNSNLTPRQTDAITDRVNFYNQGLYVVAKG